MSARIDTVSGGDEGVVLALGDRFGGYALFLVDGHVHFTFARSSDSIELAAPASLAPGPHDIGVVYAVGRGEEPGRMELVVDQAIVDQTEVLGMLPLALQHGGAGLRLGYDTGFPVSTRYQPPAPFDGVVHHVQIDTAGALLPEPEDEVRVSLRAD
jgi:arylsulfatase